MICINGAGIAGLTLANCLEKLKIDYFVIENLINFVKLGQESYFKKMAWPFLELLICCLT